MKMGSWPIAPFWSRNNLKHLASQKQATLENELSFTMCFINFPKMTLQSSLHNSIRQGTVVRGSVTKYIFAKFKGIFAKLSSKIMVGVVLTEKDCGEDPYFGLDRSATHFSLKNCAWTKRCAHALRRIRYMGALWNEKWCKPEIREPFSTRWVLSNCQISACNSYFLKNVSLACHCHASESVLPKSPKKWKIGSSKNLHIFSRNGFEVEISALKNTSHWEKVWDRSTKAYLKENLLFGG